MIVEKFYKAMLLPRKYWECLLVKIPESSHKLAVVEWINNIQERISNGQGLFLFGEHNSGKSCIAAIILKAALSKKIVGLWINSEDVAKFRLYEDDYMYSENLTMLERMQSVPILVLDDMFIREKSMQKSQYIESSLDNLIRRRKDNNLSTVITTAHDPREIKERMPSLYSAMVDNFKLIKVIKK